MWEDFKTNKSDHYKDAFYESCKKGNENLTLHEQKVILQSFYCQTQETCHLVSLIGFLKLKYLACLEKEKKEKFTDYYPIIDKKVDLPAQYTLFIVLFFDAIYLTSPNDIFNNNLTDYIKEYNETNGTCVIFAEKPIEQNTSKIKDVEELLKFLKIDRWLRIDPTMSNLNLIKKSLD